MQIIYITILTIFASSIGTLTGFGTSTIMVPILLFFLPLPQTLLLVGIIHWFGDIWKILLFKKGFNWKLIITFGVTGTITSYIGANIMLSIPEKLLSQILGGFLISYVVFLSLKPKFKIKKNTALALTGGSLSGFFAGIFGVGGAIRSLFLSTFDLPKTVYVATTGAIAIFIDSTRIITYISNGTTLDTEIFWSFLLLIPASFLGAKIAKTIVTHIPQKKFRIIILAFLLIVGLKFLFLTN